MSNGTFLFFLFLGLGKMLSVWYRKRENWKSMVPHLLAADPFVSWLQIVIVVRFSIQLAEEQHHCAHYLWNFGSVGLHKILTSIRHFHSVIRNAKANLIIQLFQVRIVCTLIKVKCLALTGA